MQHTSSFPLFHTEKQGQRPCGRNPDKDPVDSCSTHACSPQRHACVPRPEQDHTSPVPRWQSLSLFSLPPSLPVALCHGLVASVHSRHGVCFCSGVGHQHSCK